MSEGFPANYLDPGEHRAEPSADPRRQPGRHQRAVSAVRGRHRAPGRRRLRRLGRLHRQRRPQHRRAAQPQPAGQRQRRPAVSELRAHPVARPDRRVAATRASTCRSRSACRRATASASPTRSATRGTRRRSIWPPPRAASRTPTTSRPGKGPSDFDIRHRFVTNFVVQPPIRRRPGREPGRASATPCSAAGRWPASTPPAPAVRSR